MKILKKLFSLGLIVLMVTSLYGCGGESSKDEKVIRIAHKNYTEQRLLGQMFKVLIESNTDYKTDVTELGGTVVCFEALKNGEIDMYPEYTGSAYSAVLKQSGLKDSQEVYNYCKEQYEDQYNITWLKPLGFSNSYALTVTKDTSEELGINTISDLVKYTPDMIISSDMEFLARQDGIYGLKEEYGIEKFKEEKSMDIGLTYAALKEGKIDVNSSFSTDGRIAKFGLVVLEDDKNFFPPYTCTPIVPMSFVEQYPDVVELLNSLGDKFSDEDMQKINLRVDEGEDAKIVAEDILREKGLIQ